MRRTFFLFLSMAVFGGTEQVYAQKSSDIESQVSYIVTCSFRLAASSKIILDSLYPIITATNDGKLTAFYEAYNAEWVAYFSDRPQSEKQEAVQKINDLAEASPYKELRAHVLFWTGIKNLFTAETEETKALTKILKGKKLPYAIEYYKVLANGYSCLGD